MDDDLREAGRKSEGIRILGAEEAAQSGAPVAPRRGVAAPRPVTTSSWDDEEEEVWDDSWMSDAEDLDGEVAELGLEDDEEDDEVWLEGPVPGGFADPVGDVAVPTQPRRLNRDRPAIVPAHNDVSFDKNDVDDEDDDALYEEEDGPTMLDDYDDEESDEFPDHDGSDRSDGGWAASGSRQGRSSPVADADVDGPPRTRARGGAPAARVVAINDDDSPDDGRSSWATFAGQGPRWRNDAEDWGDVDDADPRDLADDDTRVGTLDPNRRTQSDRYEFDDEPQASEPRIVKIADDAGGVATKTKGGSSGSSGRPGSTPQGGSARSSQGGTRRSSSAGGGRPDARRVEAQPARPASVGARVITGLALVVVVTLVLKFIGRPGGVALAMVALPMAALEFYTALRQRGFAPAILPGVLTVFFMPFVAYKRGASGIMVVLVLAVITILLWYLLGVVRDRPAVNMAVSILGVLYVGLLGSTIGIMMRHPDGIGILVAALVGTVAYDVIGYFVGSNLGRSPLVPDISPNKTVEGLVGGMLGAILSCVFLLGLLKWAPWDTKSSILVGVAIALAAPVGDLCESMIKRDLGIKDMGSVLPGHGGVLDRIDALIFVVPVVFLVALRVLDLQSYL